MFADVGASQSPVAHWRSVLAHTTPWMACASVSGSISWNTPCSRPRWKLFDEGLEHLGVCGLNQLWRGEHLGLRLQGQAAEVGLDVLLEGQVQPRVNPGGYRLNRVGVLAIFVRSLRISTRAISRKTAATNWSFESK